MSLYIIQNSNREEIKIKSSRFICSLRYVSSVEEAKVIISEISSEFKDATHNCWAYIVGKNGEVSHSSDNGEPSGSAGKPILNTLLKYNLTNVIAIVTRYYGGTKLGVRGLIDAYSESTEIAILSNQLKEFIDYKYYKIIVQYDFSEILKHKVTSLNGNIEDSEYTDKVILKVSIEDNYFEEIELYLSEMKNREKLDFYIL